jgi:hypothetical protein
VKRGSSCSKIARAARAAAGCGLCATLLASGCGGGSSGVTPKDGGGGSPDGGMMAVGGIDGGAEHAGDGGVEPFDEQALIHRVYAEFGDDRLPASAPRPSNDNPDSTVMLEVARRFPTLTAATQAILDPFLRPPGDPDSWYATHSAAAGSAAPLAFEETAAAPNPRCGVLASYQMKATAHTNIWYRTGDTMAELLANALVAEVEAIYAAETGLFGRFPPSDLNATSTCNGGDGALDIYLVPFYADFTTVKGRTIPYARGCGAGPSFIELNVLGYLTPKKAIAVLAHEFFHTLQLGAYTFAAACSDYDWLGEATANWAIDHVFPNNQTEVPYAGTYMAEERKVPLDEAFQDDSDQANGYSDYVFLEYLARKHSPNAMRTMWDATELFDSAGAVAAGMEAGGGAKEVWPRFALATWNDATAGVQNELATWDSAPPRLDWGMKKVFDLKDAGGNVGDASTPVKLEGMPGRTFKLMQTAVASGAVALKRLSVHADYLKFVDENVRSVLFMNPTAVAPADANLRIQALVKKGGSWAAPEDWTKELTKSFCRDLSDERIEELVLIYSNSDTRRPSNPIRVHPAPLLSVSNVGCWRWQGTASVDEQVMAPGSSANIKATAPTVTFERWRPVELPDGAPGKELFQVVEGTVNGSSTTVQACTITASGGGAIPMGIASGSLDVWLGLDLGDGMPDRRVAGVGGSSHPTHTVLSCPNADPIVVDADNAWSWMELPQPDEQMVEVKADGTIQGTFTRTFMAPFSGTRKMTWMLSPMRQ